MKKVLTKIFSLNFLTAGLNFLTTIFVIKLFGLEIFGEFSILNSYIGLILLFYIILPSDYSVFKLQDDTNFINILVVNYIVNSLLISVFIILINYFFYTNLNLYIFILFTLFKGVMTFFDTYYKAIDKLDLYFIQLFMIALFKSIILLLLYFIKIRISLNSIVLLNLFPLIIAVLYGYIKIDFKFKLKIDDFFLYFKYVKDNIKMLKNYYFNVILKRIKDNSTIIVLSNIVSNEIIALYVLFTRITMFVLGQARVLEAYFMNRNNLKNMKFFENKHYFIGLVLQILIIFIGIIYLKLSVNHYYLTELSLYSFISYPYIQLLFIRNRLIANYRVNLLNLIYINYILYLISLYFLSKFIELNFITLIIGLLLIEIFNIYFLKFKMKGVK